MNQDEINNKLFEKAKASVANAELAEAKAVASEQKATASAVKAALSETKALASEQKVEVSAKKSEELEELIKNSAQNTAAKPAITPPKTAARYLNDTLFASNFGSVLVSLVNFSKDDKISNKLPGTGVILFAIFFVLFRLKSYLDDNASFMKKEENVSNNKGKPSVWQKWSLTVSICSWLLYSISGFFIFTNPMRSYLFLGLSFIIFSIWIVVNFWWNKKEEENNHWVFLNANLAYMLVLTYIYFELEFGIPYLKWVYFGLLAPIIFLDFRYSKSLDSSYK